MTKVIVVNKKDQILDYQDKEKCHQKKGVLHRAFSIVVINGHREILLQQRSKYKMLWPLFWSNTCCSHPNAKNAKKENAKNAKKNLITQAEQKLKEEMGFTISLKPIFKFEYQAKYKDVGVENELTTVLLGKYKEQKIKPDKNEVADYCWVSLDKLNKEIKKRPEIYTPWLKEIIKKLDGSKSFT